MRPRPLGPRPGSVDALLGPEHPLARDLESRAAVARDAPTVLVAAACGGVAAIEGMSWGLPVVLGAAGALVLLAAAAAVLHGRERAHALQLIAEGRERLPLPAVERERRRLLDAAVRRHLATSLLAMVGPAAERAAGTTPGAPPLFDVTMLREVAPDIRRLAALLQDEPSGARGVALVERMLTRGLSPLYGRDAQVLREELHRLQYLLSR